jgi:hypothetical protein
MTYKEMMDFLKQMQNPSDDDNHQKAQEIMTIVDAMRDALELAQAKGIEPTTIKLGPSKWEQWEAFAAEAKKEAITKIPSHGVPCVMPTAYTFGGVPVEKMRDPGILIG